MTTDASARMSDEDADELLRIVSQDAPHCGGHLGEYIKSLRSALGAACGERDSAKLMFEAMKKCNHDNFVALKDALVERDRARSDALEEAAKACETLTGSDATPTLRPGARMCLHRIRALNSTPALNAPEGE